MTYIKDVIVRHYTQLELLMDNVLFVEICTVCIQLNVNNVYNLFLCLSLYVAFDTIMLGLQSMLTCLM